MYKRPTGNIVTLTKTKTLEWWTGHLISVDSSRTVKKIFEGKPDGRRDRELPRVRWLDCVKKIVKELGIERLRKKTRGQTRMGYHSKGSAS